MGLLFSKNFYSSLVEENKCLICDRKLENESYILCKSTNISFHLECLTEEHYHLESCQECKKMYIYMNVVSNLLNKEEDS